MPNFVNDNCRLLGTSLTTTNNTAVFTAPANNYDQVIGVRVANITALDATLSLRWFDSSANASFCLIFQHAVPANGAVWFPLHGFALDESDEIRAQAGTSNALDVIVSIAERPGRSG
jgi:hypothetical protein